MRRARWVILVAILIGIIAVGATYRIQSRQEQSQATVVRSPPLPANVKSIADNWRWSHNVGGRSVVEIEARSFTQVDERFDLEGVDLRLFHKAGETYDHVKSARARFDVTAGLLYSEGEVEITMGVPADATKKGRLVNIKSSGVTFESKTGKASTERQADFMFDHGEGRAVGASYDPTTRELHMRSAVELHWRGKGGKTPPMKIESGELNYRESDAKILLSPWSKLTRGTLRVEAGPAIVTLKDGVMEMVEAPNTRGVDHQPGRELEFGAEQVVMHFDKDGQVTKITGEHSARLVSTATAARTTMTSARVDLDFDPDKGESILQKALATGGARVEAAPIPRPGVQIPDTRIMTSDVIELKMRPGGREIDAIEAHAPGRLEFVPNRAGQKRREMTGERMWIAYGSENRISSFRSVKVATKTSGLPTPKQPTPPDALTWSQDLKADFDPKTGEMARIEQWNDFRFEEGPRRARADKASLQSATNVITLAGSARISDPSGSANAPTIILHQNTGDFQASGGVTSTRLPDKKAGSPSMLSQSEAVQAKAERMASTDGGTVLRYEGAAVLWQGAHRLQADTIEIDRNSKRLGAQGNVVSRFVDEPSEKDKKKPVAKTAGPVFTVITAPTLIYMDQTRLAHYEGGAHLVRPGMDVKSEQIRAYLKAGESGSSLDKAYADGTVQILQSALGRTRRGSSEHALYEVTEDKVTLTGGSPSLIDSLRGNTRGDQLTWFARDDRLLVNGAPSQPAVSRIIRK